MNSLTDVSKGAATMITMLENDDYFLQAPDFWI